MNEGTTKLGHQVAIDPAGAARTILAKVRAAKGDLSMAADSLDVGRSTLDRLVRRLGIEQEVQAARKAVGWFARKADADRERQRERASRPRPKAKGKKHTAAHNRAIRRGVLRARSGG